MSTMGSFPPRSACRARIATRANDSEWENYALDTNPKKRTARRMIADDGRDQKRNFAGRQVVTCYSCHRGGRHPKVTPNRPRFTASAGRGSQTNRRGARRAFRRTDSGQIYPGARRHARLAGLTSYVAKGTSSGYGPECRSALSRSTPRPRPAHTIIHTCGGDSITTYDGRRAGSRRRNRPVPVLPLTGGELDGAKLEAEMAFPGPDQAGAQQVAGRPAGHDQRPRSAGRPGNHRQAGRLATLYFDAESGLLVRLVRFAESPVGRIATQVDYSDYRDVAGVKMPFHWTVTLVGRTMNYELTEIQPNVAIDAAKFAKPAPPAAPAAKR